MRYRLYNTHTRSGQAGNGFSLVELLVSITVLSLIFGLAIASYSRFNRRERIKQAGQTLRTDLRYAQTRAISAQKPDSGCTTFTGMRFTFVSGGYTIAHECTEGVVGAGDTKTLPDGVTFSPVPSAFTFLALTRRSSHSADQTLTLTNGTDSYSVQVTREGEVNDLGY